MFVINQSILALYQSDRTVGIVINSGDNISVAVPIYEDFSLPNSISYLDLSGENSK